MKRDKNLKITEKTHQLLKKYCEQNGLKMFAYVEKLINEFYLTKNNHFQKIWTLLVFQKWWNNNFTS